MAKKNQFPKISFSKKCSLYLAEALVLQTSLTRKMTGKLTVDILEYVPSFGLFFFLINIDLFVFSAVTKYQLIHFWTSSCKQFLLNGQVFFVRVLVSINKRLSKIKKNWLTLLAKYNEAE